MLLMRLFFVLSNIFILLKIVYRILPMSMLRYLPKYRCYHFWYGYSICCFYWAISVSFLSLWILLSILSFYLLLLAVFDADYFILPDNLTFWLLFIGLAINFSSYGIMTADKAFYGFIFSSALFFSLYLMGYAIYRYDVLGFGDVKFFSAIGAWCGVDLLFYILFLASLFGVFIYIGSLLIIKEKENNIAFGSCLSFAVLIVLGFTIS